MNLSDIHNKNKTDARLALYDLGYTPIKLDGKIPTYKGWDAETVDKALITSKEWDRDGKRVNTGIRCVGTEVIGLDVDIADEDLVNDFFNHMIDLGFIDDENHPPVRIGRAPRELWVFRTGGKPMVPRRSASYAADTDKYLEACEVRDRILSEVDESNVREMMQRASKAYASFDIETYAIETPRQFAAFGVHPGTGQPFEWPYGDLPPVDELPVLDDLDGVFNLFYELMAGYVQTSSGVSTGTFQHETDQLTGGSVLVTEDYGALTCDEALARFKPGFSCRCAPSAVRPISVDTNNGQLRILRDGSGLQLTDYPAAKVYEYRQGPSDVANKLAEVMTAKLPKLAALITKVDAERAQPAEELETKAAEPAELLLGYFSDQDPEDIEIWKENIRAAREQWVLVGGESVFDTVSRTETKLSGHRENFAACRFHYRTETPAGNPTTKTTSIYDVWKTDPDKSIVSGVAGHPARSAPFYDYHGQRIFNNWRAAALPTDGGDAQPMLDHIKWLLPSEAERRDFMNWLADMVQHRGVRRYGVLMITEAQGTGRDTLQEAVRRMLGEHNCAVLETEDLTSTMGQSQYNDWLVGKELFTIAEVHDDGASKGQQRAVYTRIKSYLDPRDKPIRIRRKGLPNFQADVFGSFLMASNNPDALSLSDKDRRVAVYSNPVERLDARRGEYLNRVWMRDPANIGALLRYFQNYEVDAQWSRVHPPVTEAKMVMHEESRAPCQQLVYEIVDILGRMRIKWVSTPMITAIVNRRYSQLARDPATAAVVTKEWGSYWPTLVKSAVREATLAAPAGTESVWSPSLKKMVRLRITPVHTFLDTPQADLSDAALNTVCKVLESDDDEARKLILKFASSDL